MQAMGATLPNHFIDVNKMVATIAIEIAMIAIVFAMVTNCN